MRHVATTVLLALASEPAHTAIEPGNYLLLYAVVLGCGDETHLVDYAQVPQNGTVTFIYGVQVSVLGLNEEEIASRIARGIGAKTGHTPKTLSVRVVQNPDWQRMAGEFWRLMACDGPVDPSSPQPPVEGYNRRLANAAPDSSLRTLPLCGCGTRDT